MVAQRGRWRSRPQNTASSTARPQSQTAEFSTSYRKALTGEVPPPRNTPVQHPSLPAVTLVTKIQDCMQLSLQRFLTLLGNHHCAIGPCSDARPRTRRLGTSALSAVSRAWLTWRYRPTPPDNQSVALPEEDTQEKSLSPRVATQKRCNCTRRLLESDPERFPPLRRPPRDLLSLAQLWRTLSLPGPQKRPRLRSERGSPRIAAHRRPSPPGQCRGSR